MTVCERKYRYPSKRTAKNVARKASARSGDKLFVYECSHCHGWHLTHMPPEIYRRYSR